MPCQSYETSWAETSNDRNIKKLKAEADKLARIACKAMAELENNNIEDLLLLKDDEVRTWWKKHKEDDAREQARLSEIERKERVKQEALASLSDEAKELLGLIPLPAKNKKQPKAKQYDEDEDEIPYCVECGEKDCWGECMESGN